MRAGGNLIVAGVVGVAFFWATDPQVGLVASADALVARDVVNRALPGTLVGLVGSALILLSGAWLSARQV